jgi:hypothetical protein
MESVLMIFSTLCVVMYSGGIDCSYEWTEVPQPVLMKGYREAGGTKPYTSEKLLGFVDMDEKKLWLNWPAYGHTITHEIKHAVCHLELERHGVNHPKCKGHFGITLG